MERPPPKIHIVAEVHERSTFLAGTAVRQVDLFAAGFELIPLRPGFTDGCPTLTIYIRALPGQRTALSSSTLVLIAQCLSSDPMANGLNQSIVGQKMGTIVEFDVEARCSAYVIRAHRQLAAGAMSREELLILPALRSMSSLNFTWIKPLHPEKMVYAEGELLEVTLPTDFPLSYMLSCNSKEVIAANAVGGDGRLTIAVRTEMQGACTLVVYSSQQEKFHTDMYMFFASIDYCPPNEYSLRASTEETRVFKEVGVELQAKPNSLATLHLYDSRLESLLNEDSNRRREQQYWNFQELLKPEGDQPPQPYMANLIDVGELFASTKETCLKSGRYVNLPCPRRNSQRPSSASFLSDMCLSRLTAECEKQRGGGANNTLTDRVEQQVYLSKSLWTWGRAPATSHSHHSAADDEMHAPMTPLKGPAKSTGDEDDTLTVRDMFPEVWLFDDYTVGVNGLLRLKLKSPHSVTEWRLAANFWSKGRGEVCKLRESPLVKTLRHVFMDVDLPTSVYENETINVRVTVTADNFNSQEKRMSICFRGLSPSVCGDTGQNGTLGELEWSRIILSSAEPIQVKQFYVSFLREGFHNLSFELREENSAPGGSWHCRDDDVQVFDRISKLVHVKKRVTTEDHFRQIIVYTQRRIIPAGKRGNPRVFAVSSPDIISYSQSTGGDREVAYTDLKINTNERVFNLDLEFSEFTPSFPPFTLKLSQLLSPNSPMRNRARRFGRPDESHRRNTGLISSLRDRSSDDAVGMSYSIVNVLKELSTVTYELKTLRAMDVGGEEQEAGVGDTADDDLTERKQHRSDEIRIRETNLGHLLSELLTFSDCRHHSEPCAYGEFRKPRADRERNILLTTLATSLLCEQNAGEEYVCGPLLFLADAASKLNASSAGDWNLGFNTHLSIEKQQDQLLFIQAFIALMSMDCNVYSCVSWFKHGKSSMEAWKNLHSSFYKFDENDEFDLRTEAALAYTSTPMTTKLMRHRLGTRAKGDQMPFWSISSHSPSGLWNYLDYSLTRGGNLLANSLALLAYSVKDSFYQFWKAELDFDALANWLIEEQSANRQFEGAIVTLFQDTYFGSRALYNYQLRQKRGGGRRPQIYGNLTSTAASLKYHFNGDDLPFSLSLPPSTPSLSLSTRGDGRLLVGIRLRTEARRRPKRRDPSERLLFPVTITLEQRRNPYNENLINQTVTLTTHSPLLKTLEVEHGLFTGFTSQTHHVALLSEGGEFLVAPLVSATAVNFIVTGLERDKPFRYTITQTEPSTSYSPSSLAPVSILARHHNVVGRYIVEPASLSFASSSSQIARQKRSHARNYGRPIAAGLVSPSRLVSTSDDLSPQTSTLAGLVSPAQRNPVTVDKVCLDNGACTCAESTCGVQCTNCAQLSKSFLCEEMQKGERFGLVFRRHEENTANTTELVNLDGTEYTVLDVEIRDWLNASAVPDVDERRPMSLWIRAPCNAPCVKIMNGEGKKTHYLLIGDSLGLFDGSHQGEGAMNGEALEQEDEEEKVDSRRKSKKKGRKNSSLRLNYVLKDEDRLVKSTDCHAIFSPIHNGQC